MNFRKSQTATEYIVIVAVVIVIALVVVQIMGGFPGIGSGTSKKVSDYKLASNGEIGIEKYDFFNGYVLAKVKNNYYETLTVNNLTISGSNGAGVLCYLNNTNISGTANRAFPLTLNPGQSNVINCTGAFNETQNNGATPSVSSTYTNPTTGASYTVSSSRSSANSDDIPLLDPVRITTPTMTFLNAEDLTANISSYSSSVTYSYNWYQNNNLNATTLITNGLVAYWPLNNDSRDYFGSNDGTNNGSIINSTNGKVSGGAYFDGSSRVNLPSSSAWNFGAGNFTISLWGYSSSADSGHNYLYGGIMFHTKDNSGNYIGIYRSYPISGGYKSLVSIDNGGGANYFAGPDVIENSWTHYTVRRTDGNVSLYENGIYVGSEIFAGAMDYSSDGFMLAKDPWSGYLIGLIDEVAIFNRSLSDSEIQQLYEGSRLGGNIISNTITTAGDNWKVGVRSNTAGGNNWNSEINSSPVTIIP